MDPQDPKNLTDEELEKKLEEVGAGDGGPAEEPTPAPEKEEEPKPEKEPEQEPEGEPEEPGQEPGEPEGEPEEPEKPVSRREQLRVNQLLEKMAKGKEKKPQDPGSQGVDYRKLIDADEDTYKALEEASQQSGKAFYNEGLEQSKSIQFHTRLEIDAPRVEAKYPQLDKASDQFNPAIANAINTWYLQTAGFDPSTDRVENPDIRYAEFVESVFELGNAIGSEKSQRSATNIKRQAASTGLRPDGSQGKRLNLNKAPGAMTDEELDAALNQFGLGTK